MLKPKALSCVKLLSWQMSSKITEVLLDNHTLNFQISHRYKLEILYITGIEILPGFF